MSDGGRDLAKGAILTLAPTGLGFILSGWIVGVICLFIAGSLSLVLWTPLGRWLGFHPEAQDQAALQFGAIEVGKPRPVGEDNVFVEDWNGAPIVFNLLNPQGNPRARDIRPTVVVKDKSGNTLVGPTNARWANPQPPKKEEVERDLPANGAPVAIDTVIQEVGGDKFWLVTDEGLRIGLKANTKAITESSFDVIVTVQGENVLPISETVDVSLGFPLPMIRGEAERLEDQLDSLIREGRELVSELSAPVQPEKLNWVSKIVGGGPPAGWQEKADAFQQHSVDLLEARHPALLTDFRDGTKKHFAMEREAKEQREQEPGTDARSDGEKALALANHERSGPRREVEACLEGLALARKSI